MLGRAIGFRLCYVDKFHATTSSHAMLLAIFRLVYCETDGGDGPHCTTRARTTVAGATDGIWKSPKNVVSLVDLGTMRWSPC